MVESQNVVANSEPVQRVQKLDAQGRAYATGKRKSSVSRVWIKGGSGRITINGKDQNEYFSRAVLRMIISEPFEVLCHCH